MIETRIDKKRGCGWRKPGGLYLVLDGPPKGCGRLPIPFEICPCCGAGVRPARGTTWIDIAAIAKPYPCRVEATNQEGACLACPLSTKALKYIGKVLLLWVGEKFYKHKEDFTREAERLGISRRIQTLPNDFKIGQTWVALAHRRGHWEPCPSQHTEPGTCPTCKGEQAVYKPALFSIFKPSRAEYVVKGGESKEELARMVKRGITPIKVTRSQTTQEELALQERSKLTKAEERLLNAIRRGAEVVFMPPGPPKPGARQGPSFWFRVDAQRQVDKPAQGLIAKGYATQEEVLDGGPVNPRLKEVKQ